MPIKLDPYFVQTQTPDPSRAPLRMLGAPEQVGVDYNSISKIATAALTLKERSDEEQARAWTSDALSRQQLQWATELQNRQESAEPGAPDFTPRLLEDYDKSANKLLESAPTKHARNYAQHRLNEYRLSLAEKGLAFEAKARLDYKVDKFSSSIDNSAKLMNTDPSQYETVLQERTAEIDSAAMAPVQKSALRERAVNKISEAAVWAQMQRSPSAFLDSIGFNTPPDGKTRKTSGDLKGVTGNAAFDALPFEKRVSMLEKAVQMKAQIDTDVEKTSKERRIQLADESMKGIFSAHADRKLTRSMIENQRSVLTATQYESALKLLERDENGVKTDPGEYRNIMMMIAQNRFQEAESRAFVAHANGRISNGDLASLTDRARSQGRQEGPKSPFERNTNRITMSLDPGPLVQDPAGKQRHAEAQGMFAQWFNSADPKKPWTEEQIDKKADEIIDRYQLVQWKDKALTLPLPKYGNVNRSDPPEKIGASLGMAGLELRRRKAANDISDAEYNEEMRIIGRWSTMLQNRKK